MRSLLLGVWHLNLVEFYFLLRLLLFFNFYTLLNFHSILFCCMYIFFFPLLLLFSPLNTFEIKFVIFFCKLHNSIFYFLLHASWANKLKSSNWIWIQFCCIWPGFCCCEYASPFIFALSRLSPSAAANHIFLFIKLVRLQEGEVHLCNCLKLGSKWMNEWNELGKWVFDWVYDWKHEENCAYERSASRASKLCSPFFRL